MKKKKVLFIDRDGTMILEPSDHQIDSFEKLVFYPNVFQYLGRIAREMDYELVMVSNQDGLGTRSFPEESFWPVHNFIMKAFENESIHFADVFIDRSFARENLPTRKPNTGMLTNYFSEEYDLVNSFVIGDRITDVMLAKNLGCKGFWLNNGSGLGSAEVKESANQLKDSIALETPDWQKIYEYLKAIK